MYLGANENMFRKGNSLVLFKIFLRLAKRSYKEKCQRYNPARYDLPAEIIKYNYNT